MALPNSRNVLRRLGVVTLLIFAAALIGCCELRLLRCRHDVLIFRSKSVSGRIDGLDSTNFRLFCDVTTNGLHASRISMHYGYRYNADTHLDSLIRDRQLSLVSSNKATFVQYGQSSGINADSSMWMDVTFKPIGHSPRMSSSDTILCVSPDSSLVIAFHIDSFFVRKDPF